MLPPFVEGAEHGPLFPAQPVSLSEWRAMKTWVTAPPSGRDSFFEEVGSSSPFFPVTDGLFFLPLEERLRSAEGGLPRVPPPGSLPPF